MQRVPVPALRPFVKTLWAIEPGDAASIGGVLGGEALPSFRECVLPNGRMHLAFRLGEPLKVFEDHADLAGRRLCHAVVGGARGAAYLREASPSSGSVGVDLHPGAALSLFGVPASALAHHHTPLAELWGSQAADAHGRLAAATGSARKLDLLEQLLLERLPGTAALHPAVRFALQRLAEPTPPPVQDLVSQTGYSHRRFLTLFRDSVGLPPKVYARVLRFQHAVYQLRAPEARPTQVAFAAGYSDQPHFNREFRQISGLSPGKYRAVAPAESNHVPVQPSPRRSGT